MAKDPRVKHPFQSEGSVFHCATTGQYLKKALLIDNLAFYSLLAAYLFFYNKFCLLKKNKDESHEKIVELCKEYIPAAMGVTDSQEVQQIRGHLAQHDGVIRTFDPEDIKLDASSLLFSQKYLSLASEHRADDSEEQEKPKKPACHIYELSPRSTSVTRVEVADKPVYHPQGVIPNGCIAHGIIPIEQDNKSINVMVYSDPKSEVLETPPSFYNYFVNRSAPLPFEVPKGKIWIWSSSVLKHVVDNRAEEQRRKASEEHLRKVEENKAKKSAEKRSLEAAKPVQDKGRKKSKSDSE
jgi:hypothetical protein